MGQRRNVDMSAARESRRELGRIRDQVAQDDREYERQRRRELTMAMLRSIALAAELVPHDDRARVTVERLVTPVAVLRFTDALGNRWALALQPETE